MSKIANKDYQIGQNISKFETDWASVTKNFKQSNMKVSIIVAVYTENTIRRTIESIKNQSYKNIETIFIDNKSSDGSKEIIKTIYKQMIY